MRLSPNHLRPRAIAAVLLAAMLVAGCQTRGPVIGTHGGASVTETPQMSSSDIASLAQAWGQYYDQNPDDRSTILSYAAALRLNGQADQAIAVLNRGMLAFPEDREVASAYGRTLAAGGQFEQALQVIRAAQRPERPDWHLLSAEGAVLDQTGNTAEARRLYDRALQIAPNEPSILNNKALSYLLTGDLAAAEEILRLAVAQPGATSRIRQNLALALGLQGKFAEAEAVASNELDRAQAEANVAYLRSMLSQSDSWGQIAASDTAQ
jgi:Flp pilus assembly protein TadD